NFSEFSQKMDDLKLANFEIPSDLIKPADPLHDSGSKCRVKKSMYFNSPVAEKEIGKFKKNDQRLCDLEKEVKYIHKICNCRSVLTFYGFTRHNTSYSVIWEWGAEDSSISPVMLTSARERTDPRWTPPEKTRDKMYTKASEIYSFSLVLWEIINNRTPFNDILPEEITNKVLNGEHPQPERTNGTPVKYQEIMEKGWNINPTNRPTAQQMLNLLSHLESQEWFGHRLPRIGDDEHSQPDYQTTPFSPKNSKLLEFPISRLTDLASTSDSCKAVLNLFEDAKRNRDLFDKGVDIIN
ncbi:15417_t:CDS:2, partial [Funneliformis caledonium]